MGPKSAVGSFNSMRSTRRSNKESHPGQVVLDATQKRRSGQEMEQVRAEEARAHLEKQRRDNDNLKAAAEIEDRLRQEDIERRSSSRKIGGQPAFRPPPEVSSAIAAESNKDPFAESSETFHEIVESEPSGDEYTPEDLGESEVDEEELSVDEEEEEGDKPAQKKRGKQPKFGRSDITAARKITPATNARSTITTSTTALAHKRKTSGSDAAASKIKKAKRQNQQPSGIITGWDATQTSKNEDRAATSAPQAAEDVDSMVEMGGFVRDEETDDVEKKAVAKLMPGSKKKSVSIVKVSETKPLIQLRTKQQQRGGAKKSTLSHLPQGAGPAFTELLAPLAKITAGTLPAWASLSVQQIQLLVDEVYGIGTHVVIHDDVWCDLVGYRLSNWRNAFYTHARTAVNDHMSAFTGTHSTEDLINYVQVFTESSGEPPSAPFHWKDWNTDEETLLTKRSGLFENDLIIFTLAHAHFSEFDEVPNAAHMKKEEFPVGALILALQAVEHAFKFWATGDFIEDKTKHFSADKYDDKKERKTITPGGKPTIILTRRASLYLKTVQNLSVNKWVAILDQVNEVLNAGRKRKKARSKSASSCADSDMFVEESAPEFVLCSDEE